MIVVDNDVISYFWLEAGRTEAARKARDRDADWHAPHLWRSEFRNVLSQHMAHRGFRLPMHARSRRPWRPTWKALPTQWRVPMSYGFQARPGIRPDRRRDVNPSLWPRSLTSRS